MMNMSLRVVATLALCLLFEGARAYKDDSYYIAGTGNPNVEATMYWKDSENVLQDLDKFSSLYVEFQQCAWTWMQMEDDGNDVDENDYWYMGKIPPMGANVAFSLYGSLKGHTFNGCGSDSFINSFHTDQGFNVFVDSMYYAGVSGFSSAYSQGMSADCQGGYGVGCDYSTGFAVHQYASSECDPQNATVISDNLSNLNTAMKRSTCVKIYDSSRYSGYSEGTALELLSYSHSCFYQDMFSPDGSCPDPYGKLAQYQTKFHQGIQESKKRDPYQVYYYRRVYNEQIQKGKNMTYVGIAFLAIAAVVCFWNEMISERIKSMGMRKGRGEKSFPGDDYGTEAVEDDATHPADNAIEMAEGGTHVAAGAATTNDSFLGRTIEFDGDGDSKAPQETPEPKNVDAGESDSESEFVHVGDVADDALLAAELAAADISAAPSYPEIVAAATSDPDTMIFASRSHESDVTEQEDAAPSTEEQAPGRADSTQGTGSVYTSETASVVAKEDPQAVDEPESASVVPKEDPQAADEPEAPATEIEGTK